MEAELRTGQVDLAGHRVAYRVAGVGPDLVLVKPHRLPRDYPQLRLLSDRYRVIQVEPLGFGRSDRPADYPPVGVHEQILTVLDEEGVDRFVVWGYSQGAAMAAVTARASPRVAALVGGGWSPASRLSDARMRRMERDRVPVAPLTFWRWYRRFHWLDELAAMRFPVLVYVGADDGPQVRGPGGVPRTRGALTERGVTVMEFDGLDHRTCQDEPALSARVLPAMLGWLDDTLG